MRPHDLPPEETDPRRAHLALLNGAGLLLGARFLHGELNEWGGDNVDFLVLARALADGMGYVNAHVVGAPPHLRYPPGLPALIAPLVALGASLYWIKAFVALLGLAGLNLAYIALRRLIAPTAALLAAGATLVSCVFLDPALSVMSDGPYLLASLAALLAADDALRAPDAGWRRTAAAGLLVGLATLTRVVGVVLGPAIVLAALLGPSPVALRARLARTALIGVLALFVAGPWLLRVASAAPAQVSYATQFERRAEEGGGADRLGNIGAGGSSLVERPWLNALDLYGRARSMPPPELVRDGPGWLEAGYRGLFLASLVGGAALTLVGLGAALARRRRVFDLHGACYLALLSFWVGGGPRLLVPVLPFLFAWTAEGARVTGSALSRLARRAPLAPPAARRVELATLAALLLLNAAATFLSPRIRHRLAGTQGGWWPAYVRAVDQVAALAAPGERLFCQPNNLPYYRHGMVCARLDPRRHSDEEILEGLVTGGTTFLIDSPFLYHEYRQRIGRTIERNPSRFEELADFGRVKLYRFLAEPRAEAAR